MPIWIPPLFLSPEPNPSEVIEKSQKNPKREPPIYNVPSSHATPLHAYTAMPPSTITVLGARRFPAIAAPMGNSQNGISIFASTGFQGLSTEEYETATETLKPDIVIPLADLTPSSATPKPKRALRMAERTEDWLNHWFRRLDPDSVLKPSNISVFAPVLPIPYPMQWEYLNRLSEDHQQALSGLAIYDTDILPDLKNYSSLLPLPRLSLDEAATPHGILKQISLGVDIFLLPFINTASDNGIALTFTFPAPQPAATTPPTDPNSDTAPLPALLPLGIDMSSPTHQTSLLPLRPGCACHTCTHHHRAYVHHLLRAREMLGWTLLQIHNHRVASDFFAGVRASYGAGLGAATDVARFAAAYEPDMPPAGADARPRARGYHFRSEGGDERRNRPAWGRLGGDGEEGVDGPTIAEDGAAVRDSVQTPLVPDGDSAELDRRAFAEVEGKER